MSGNVSSFNKGLYGSSFRSSSDLGMSNSSQHQECEICMRMWSDICLAHGRNDIFTEEHLIELLEQHVKNSDTGSLLPQIS